MKKAIFLTFLSFALATIIFQLQASSANPQFKKLYDIVYSQSVSKNGNLRLLEKALSSDKPIIVEFYSDYCSTCVSISPLLNSIMSDYKEKAAFFTINIDDNPELADNFNIKLIPAIYAINPSKDEMVEIPAHLILDKSKFKGYLDSVLGKFN